MCGLAVPYFAQGKSSGNGMSKGVSKVSSEYSFAFLDLVVIVVLPIYIIYIYNLYIYILCILDMSKDVRSFKVSRHQRPDDRSLCAC